jgi:hypothetical protein
MLLLSTLPHCNLGINGSGTVGVVCGGGDGCQTRSSHAPHIAMVEEVGGNDEIDTKGRMLG